MPGSAPGDHSARSPTPLSTFPQSRSAAAFETSRRQPRDSAAGRRRSPQDVGMAHGRRGGRRWRGGGSHASRPAGEQTAGAVPCPSPLAPAVFELHGTALHAGSPGGPAQQRRAVRRLPPPPPPPAPNATAAPRPHLRRRPPRCSATWRGAAAATGRRWPPTRSRSCTTRMRTATTAAPSGTWRWRARRRVCCHCCWGAVWAATSWCQTLRAGPVAVASVPCSGLRAGGRACVPRRANCRQPPSFPCGCLPDAPRRTPLMLWWTTSSLSRPRTCG